MLIARGEASSSGFSGGGGPQERDVETEARHDREPWAGNPLVLEIEADLGHPEIGAAAGRDDRARNEYVVSPGQTLRQGIQALEEPAAGELTHVVIVH